MAAEEELNELKSELSNLSKSISSLVETIDKSKRSFSPVTASVASLSQQLNEYKTKISQAKQKTDDLKSQQSKAQENVKKYNVLLQKQIDAMLGFRIQDKFLAEARENLASAMDEEFTHHSEINKAQKNLEAMSKKLEGAENNLAEAFKKYREELMDSLKKSIGQLERSMGIGPIGTTITNIISDIGSARGGLQKTIAALSGVAGAFTSLRESAVRVQYQLGSTLGTASELLTSAQIEAIKSITAPGAKVGAEEIIDATKAFKEEFGTILDPSEARNIAQQAKALGVNADVFVKARRAFLTTGDVARTQATFTSTFVRAGLTQAQAFQFAAQNADLVAVAGSKYAEALARAAANATKIGVSLSKTEDFANNLVGDFEGGLEKFAELSAMGFEFNVNRLFAISQTGTAEDVQKELQSELARNQGMLRELQRSRTARIALQQATGLGMADIEKLAGIAKLPTEKTEAEKPEDKLQSTLAKSVDTMLSLGASLVSLGAVVGLNTIALLANTAALGNKTVGSLMEMLTGPGKLATAARFGAGATGTAIGVAGGTAIGTAMGASPTKSAIGSLLGSGAGWALAAALAPETGGLSLLLPFVGSAVGGLGGGALTGALFGKAEGGLITGPGTATSDNILTPTSPGEFVVNAKATQTYGTDFLNKINSAAYAPEAPAVNNTVNIDMSKLESKLDKLASSFGKLTIQMSGYEVGNVSLNDRSPLFTASPSRVVG
jgi:hypothetical protein